MVLGGVAMGVRKQHEADMAMPMAIGRGEMPLAKAMGRAKGAMRAAVAVFDIKLVMAAVSVSRAQVLGLGYVSADDVSRAMEG